MQYVSYTVGRHTTKRGVRGVIGKYVLYTLVGLACFHEIFQKNNSSTFDTRKVRNNGGICSHTNRFRFRSMGLIILLRGCWREGER